MRMISGFLDGAGESMNGQRRAGGILRAIEQLDGKDPARGWARFRESWRHEAEMMRGLLSIGEVGEKTKYTLSTAEATTTGYTAVDTDDTLKEYIEAQRQAAERLEKLTAKEAIRALDRAMAVAQRVDDGAAAGRFDEASRIAREATEKDELGLADWLMGKTWISNDGRANLVERLEALKQRLRGMISVAPK
ncbi:MAG: hypothetical protein IT435_11760 [Phycisphaerales bacterium]|nr:hypothetical protein [Phycisphaerales bacterium]